MRPVALCALACLFGATSISYSQTPPAPKLPFTFDAMMKLARIQDPVLSPDGKLIAFVAQTIDLPGNTKPAQIYLVSIDGGTPQQLTREGQSNARPRWSPDSKRIFFQSDRKDGTQIWSMTPDGSDQRQMTTIATGAEGEVVSPDGKLLLFKSDIYPGCIPLDAKPGVAFDATCNKTKQDADGQSKMHARVYTTLLYRHWTEYQGNKRSHLFLQKVDDPSSVRDMTPGSLNVPPFALGGPEPFTFSPDSRQITYVANIDPNLATSTNSDLFTVSVEGGVANRITTNPGADDGPLYSPDGKYLAYRTQLKPGYESDQWKLAILDLQAGTMNTLTDTLDRWVESYTWSPDSKRIFFTIDDHGTNPLLVMPVTGGAIRTIAQGPTSLSDIQFAPDNKTMVYLEQSGSEAPEIYRVLSKGGGGIPLTHMNDPVKNTYELTPLERMSVDAPDGTKVESFIVKPPNFNPASRYPVLFQIHGGPEGDWGETWSYRWNPEVFAAAGFIVVLPNPHGSIGYGQAFTDAVNGDWGGHAYEDIMLTVDSVGKLPYVDTERMVAAGGSYGGYMIDWILGHTDRFKALVSHAGVYDLRSEAGTTEELWFPKWEFQGLPWENPELYDKWSPSMFVKNFKTPTLVTHGELDYRVPIGQGQQLFTALQEMNVPSRLVQFPDEGHWILKPQNSQFWYQTVIDWLNQWTRGLPGTASSATAPGQPQ